MNSGPVPREVTVLADGREFRAIVRIDTPGEAEYYRHGGIMQYCAPITQSPGGANGRNVADMPDMLLPSPLARARSRTPWQGSSVAERCPEPAVRPATAKAQDGLVIADRPALFVAGIVVLAFNLRGAITSLPPVFPELASTLHLSSLTIAAARCHPGAVLRGVLGPAAPLSRRFGEERVLLAALAAARCGAAAPRRVRPAGCSSPALCLQVRGHRADERAAAEPGQAAPPGSGGPADRGLPAQPGRRGDPRLADRGAAVPVLRRLGPADPGPVGAAGASGGAGLAAAVAVPDRTGRSRRRPSGGPSC